MRTLYQLRHVAVIVRLICGARAGASVFVGITNESTAAYTEYWEDAAKLNAAHSPLISVKDDRGIQQLLVPSS